MGQVSGLHGGRRQALLGYCHSQLGDRESARRLLRIARGRLERSSSEDVEPSYGNPYPPYQLARAHAAAGADEEALVALEQAIRRGLAWDTLDWREQRRFVRNLELDLFPSGGEGRSDAR